MNTRANLATLLTMGSLFLVGAGAQAMANSPMTDAFVANVQPNVDFLDRSSRMALDKTASPALRAFAHREALQQTIAANSLVAWSQANTVPGAAIALGTPVIPVGGVLVVPTEATTAPGAVLTGRSVAEDRPLTVTRAPRETTLPATGDTLARLSALTGPEFDALYRSTQGSSLRQLSAIYNDYAQRGDDASLRAMAIRELPKINRRLAELRRL